MDERAHVVGAAVAEVPPDCSSGLLGAGGVAQGDEEGCDPSEHVASRRSVESELLSGVRLCADGGDIGPVGRGNGVVGPRQRQFDEPAHDLGLLSHQRVHGVDVHVGGRGDGGDCGLRVAVSSQVRVGDFEDAMSGLV